MPTLSTNNPTLIDWAKTLDPDGSPAAIIELLSQTNEILTDAVWIEGNLPTGHRVTQRTGLPAVYFRLLNQGIPPSKATSAQIDEACSILESRSEPDKDLVMLNGNTARFRLSQAKAFLEAMNQRQATELFYGNPTSAGAGYVGFAPRYSDPAAGNGRNILNAGGTGTDNTSIWLVVWGDESVFCPFPKGSQAGLMHRDLGEQTVYKPDGTRLQAMVDHFQWKCGLAVADWRQVCRISNIDVSDLRSSSGTQATTAATNILRQMNNALDTVNSLSMGKACFYMNRTVFQGLRNLSLEKNQNVLSVEKGLSAYGTPMNWLQFLGVPLRKTDALLNTEAAITFA